MVDRKREAERAFWRMVRWITVAGILMVIGSLAYLHFMDAWSTHAAVAVFLGVFISVMLGCGLFALAFFSDKSGHDDDVTGATRRKDQ